MTLSFARTHRFGVLLVLCAARLAGAEFPAYGFVTLAGSPGSHGNADGVGAAAKFSSPVNLATSPAGTVYVTDSLNGNIRVIDADGRVTTAYQATDPFSRGSNFAPVLAGASLDAAGNFYFITGDQNRILKLSPAGAISVQATLPAGSWGFGGLVLDVAGNLFLTRNHLGASGAEVLKVSPDGSTSLVADRPSGIVDPRDGTPAQFRNLGDLVVDAGGNLLVCDPGNNGVIWKITPAGVVSVFAGEIGTFGDTDGALAVARFRTPRGASFDNGGNLFVVDGFRVRRIGADGQVSTVAGRAVPGGDDGTGTNAGFSSLWDVAADASGNIFVADTGNYAIRKISPAGEVTTLAGDPSIGRADATGSRAAFNRPLGVAIDGAGNAYVADSENQTIRKVTPAGVVTTFAGTPGLGGFVDGPGATARLDTPRALAIDAAGNLYVGGVLTVRRVTPDGFVTTIANIGTQAIAVDAAGSLYIGRGFFISVLRGGNLEHFAGSESSSGYVDGPGADARFQGIGGLAAAPDGAIYVSEVSTVRRVALDGSVTTVAGIADPFRMVPNGGTGLTTRLSGVKGIAVDGRGIVFFTSGPTVRALLPSGELKLVGGNPNIAIGSADGVGSNALFYITGGIAVDGTGAVVVSDQASNTIRLGASSTATAPPLILTRPYEQSKEVGAHTGVTFIADVAGTGITYQWYRDGKLIPGATGSAFTIADATAALAGTYSVSVANSVAVAAAPIATLTVYTPAIAGFSTRRAVAGGSFLWGIASGNGRLVAVGTSGTILTSLDGSTWEAVASGVTDWLTAVTFGHGLFVAVGDRGRVLLSIDGLAWTVVDSGLGTRLSNVLFIPDAPRLFVAVGEGGTIATSPDALSWTRRDAGVTGWLRGLAYAGGKLFVSGQGGVGLISGSPYNSPLGEKWNRASMPTEVAGADLEATVYLGGFPVGAFVSIGTGGLEVDWQQLTPLGYALSYPAATGATGRLRGVAVGANAAFATGENGVVLAARGPSGPWSPLPSGTTANLVSGVYHNNSLFVVGENETILQSTPLYPDRLINISTRGFAGTGSDTLISGFVISGTRPKRVLLRAAGPALKQFGLSGRLISTSLTLYDSSLKIISQNSGWNNSPDAAAIADTTAMVGASPFAGGSGDSAILVTVNPGAYTTHLTGPFGTTGLALVEVYDADGPEGADRPMVNISTRGHVGPGDDRLIAGFVVGGTASRRVLIRVAGPALETLGVPGALARPKLELYNGFNELTASAAAWSLEPAADAIRLAAAASGATPFAEGSNDAAMVMTLNPGAWTVHVTGADGGTGIALVEVYYLP